LQMINGAELVAGRFTIFNTKKHIHYIKIGYSQMENGILLVIFFLSFSTTLSGQSNGGIEQNVQRYQTEIEGIRGKQFKRLVKSASQSEEDFGAYLENNIDLQIPNELGDNYDKIVRALGLYRGPVITDFKALAKKVLQSQAAAYYDPAKDTFFVVMQNLSEQMLASIYVHELYHGLQDQYFDLDKYMLDPAMSGVLNDDQLLARQAVAEGEATLLMTLWTMKSMMGQIPPAMILEPVIKLQGNMELSQLKEMVKAGVAQQSNDLQSALAALDEIPRFILESLLGAYMKGMVFVYEIQKSGWEKVEELYSNPPVSSEQILHPEKWLNHENPIEYRWPEAEASVLEKWKLLESNTLGEIQWRVIFAEHGLEELGVKAAAGWNGDIFGVYEHIENGEILSLIRSSWDSESEAIEFEAAYKKVVAVKKQADNNLQVEIVREKNEVYLVTGRGIAQGAAFISALRAIETSP